MRLGGRSDECRQACGTSVVAAAISKCHVFRGAFRLACGVTHPSRARSRPLGECRRWRAALLAENKYGPDTLRRAQSSEHYQKQLVGGGTGSVFATLCQRALWHSGDGEGGGGPARELYCGWSPISAARRR